MNDLELKSLAQELGLQVDEDLKIIFGQKDGYSLYIDQTGQQNQYAIHFSLKASGAIDPKEALNQLSKESKALAHCSINRYRVTCTTKGGMTKGKARENLIQGLSDALTFFKEQDFTNVCEHSGEAGVVDVYQVGNQLLILSAKSFEELSASSSLENEAYDNQSENVLTGMVGAFLGSLIGGAVILLVAQLGYVSVLGGIVMGVCTIKGYEILGKKLSTKGMVISVIFMLVMTFVANQLDLAFNVMREFQAGLFDSFQVVNQATFSGEINGQYWFNLILLYLFTAFGAGFMIKNAFDNQKQRYVLRKL